MCKKTDCSSLPLQIGTSYSQLIKGIVSLLFFAVLLCSCGKKDANTEPKYASSSAVSGTPLYSFAIHPLHNPAKLLQTYQPLIDYLNRHVRGAQFCVEASRDYASFEAKIERKKPELILPNPYQTIAAQRRGYRVIAMSGRPEEFKGLFIVRRDRDLSGFADLKGKEISYPSKTALAACIMPQFFLYKHGIDVQNDVKNSYVGSQESSIMNVYLRSVDVGVTWTTPWNAFVKDHPKEAALLKVKWETESLVNNSVMVREDVPDTIRTQIEKCLFALSSCKEGRAILQKASTSIFLPATDSDYEVVEKYIANFQKAVRRISK